jgi:glutamate-1-semialdehyde 2,1-aminomutase
MLHEGVYLPPSNYESWFLNNAMDYNHLDKVIFATERVLQAMIEAGEVPMPGRA